MASPGYPDGLGQKMKFAKKTGPEHEGKCMFDQPQLEWSEGAP